MVTTYNRACGKAQGSTKWGAISCALPQMSRRVPQCKHLLHEATIVTEPHGPHRGLLHCAINQQKWEVAEGVCHKGLRGSWCSWSICIVLCHEYVSAPGVPGKVFPRFGVAPQVGVKDSHTSVWPLEWSITHKRGIL